MTKRRMATLILGVVFLGTLTLWKLYKQEGPPSSPSRPVEASEEDLKRAAAERRVVTFEGKTMGTSYTVKYVPPHAGILGIPDIVAASALEAVSDSMSSYRRTSEIGLFNRIGVAKPQKVSDEFWTVLLLSKKIHEQTKGAFDITIAPLVAAYGFGSGAMKEQPDNETLVALRKKVGMALLYLNEEERTIEKTLDGVQIDVGGIAKGFGVDQVANELEKIKVANYMIEVGGEIRTKGEKAENVPWTLAIEEPHRGAQKLHGTLRVPRQGLALATSGDYRNFKKVDGRIISHTFDPRSGKPTPRRTASVSVVRPTAAEADGLATALGVLSPEDAIALANEKKWAVYLLVHDESSGYTPRFSQAFGKLGFERVASKTKQR